MHLLQNVQSYITTRRFDEMSMYRNANAEHSEALASNSSSGYAVSVLKKHRQFVQRLLRQNMCKSLQVQPVS